MTEINKSEIRQKVRNLMESNIPLSKAKDCVMEDQRLNNDKGIDYHMAFGVYIYALNELTVLEA